MAKIAHTIEAVLERYFGDERTKYFHSSDRQGECYLRYRFDGGLELWMGTQSDGEIMVYYTSEGRSADGTDVETLLKLLMYGKA